MPPEYVFLKSPLSLNHPWKQELVWGHKSSVEVPGHPDLALPVIRLWQDSDLCALVPPTPQMETIQSAVQGFVRVNQDRVWRFPDYRKHLLFGEWSLHSPASNCPSLTVPSATLKKKQPKVDFAALIPSWVPFS